MAFEGLSEKLNHVFKKLRSKIYLLDILAEPHCFVGTLLHRVADVIAFCRAGAVVVHG